MKAAVLHYRLPLMQQEKFRVLVARMAAPAINDMHCEFDNKCLCLAFATMRCYSDNKY